MIPDITLPHISILDKDMMRSALFVHGGFLLTVLECEDNLQRKVDKLPEMGSTQNLWAKLNVQLSGLKVLTKTDNLKELQTQNKSLTLKINEAGVLLKALNNHSYTANDLEKARIDYITNIIYKKIL